MFTFVSPGAGAPSSSVGEMENLGQVVKRDIDVVNWEPPAGEESDKVVLFEV